MLDLQSAFDRGSRPLLQGENFLEPLNINDADVTIGTEIMHTDCFTEMTFPLLTYRAMICQHRLSDFSRFASKCVKSGSELASAWHQRQLSVLVEFEQYTQHLRSIYGPASFERFILAVARESLLSMHLLVRRPLYRISTEMRPHEDDFDTLHAATEILESAAFKASPEFMPWAWYSFTKWYALAIVLAELCSHRSWSEVEWRAWNIAEASFGRYAQLVADTKDGLLWKPIKQLMEKAQSVRKVQTLHRPMENNAAQWQANTVQLHQDGQAQVRLDTVVQSHNQKLDSVWRNDSHKLDSTSQDDSQKLDFIPQLPTDDDGMLNAEDPLSWIHWEAFLEDLGNDSQYPMPEFGDITP